MGQQPSQQILNAILMPCPLGHHAWAVRDQAAQNLRLLVRLPHLPQVITMEQVRQHLRIDLVRLGLSLGDGQALERIADHDRCHERADDLGDRPNAGRGFQSNAVRLLQSLLGKAFRRPAVAISSASKQGPAVNVENADLDESLVIIESKMPHNDRASYAEAKAGGARLASGGAFGNYLSELEA
jgi:hypothetical protein